MYLRWQHPRDSPELVLIDPECHAESGDALEKDMLRLRPVFKPAIEASSSREVRPIRRHLLHRVVQRMHAHRRTVVAHETVDVIAQCLKVGHIHLAVRSVREPHG